MKHALKIALILCLALTARSATAAACRYELTVSPGADTRLDAAADAAADAALHGLLAANGCEIATTTAADNIEIVFQTTSVVADKKLNPLGMALAGGLSSAYYLDIKVTASLEARRGGQTVFTETLTYAASPRELYSGWFRARALKKRAVEAAAEKLGIHMLKNLDCGADPNTLRVPARPANDFLNKDRDIWPILGGGFTMVGVHDAGHVFNARLTGHNGEIRSDDRRTFEATFPAVAGFSVLFSHRLGDDMQFPLPDALYDFASYNTPSGEQYLDDAGNQVHDGQRRHAVIAYSGILFQNLANEYLLTKDPHLIDRDDPFKKGMFWGNIIVPGFYTFQGYDDPNSDLKLLQQDLGWGRWAINTMVLAPLAIDLYRYYHPENKKLRRYARIAKILPVIIILSK